MRRHGTRRCFRLATAGALTLMIVGLGGCIWDPSPNTMTVRNESGSDLVIMIAEYEIRTVPAGGSRGVGLGGSSGECDDDRTYTAVDPTGRVVATLEPPVCDDDEWVIAAADVGS